MPKCEDCDSELEPLPTLFEGQAVYWVCPKQCEAEALLPYTLEEALADAEMALSPPEPTPISHCWTFNINGTHCPGVVERTEESRDGPYGNFCPVCGYSLRYHWYYGEGNLGDKAK
jgi:hypothetical protein